MGRKFNLNWNKSTDDVFQISINYTNMHYESSTYKQSLDFNTI